MRYDQQASITASINAGIFLLHWELSTGDRAYRRGGGVTSVKLSGLAFVHSTWTELNWTGVQELQFWTPMLCQNYDNFHTRVEIGISLTKQQLNGQNEPVRPFITPCRSCDPTTLQTGTSTWAFVTQLAAGRRWFALFFAYLSSYNYNMCWLFLLGCIACIE